MPCRLGRSGVTSRKREGDGKTPRGSLRLLRLLYRPDQLGHLRTAPGLSPIRRNDGWCEVPADRNYNRPVVLPYPASHESMWRADRLYDVTGVLDWNIRPRRRGKGSAIFFHLASAGGAGTAGCIAVLPADMRKLLPLLGRGVVFVVV